MIGCKIYITDKQVIRNDCAMSVGPTFGGGSGGRGLLDQSGVGWVTHADRAGGGGS